MKSWKIFVFLVLIPLLPGASASEIYQCKNSAGKLTYSDKPCAKGETENKQVIKNIPWTQALEANKPAGTKIIEVTKEHQDTVIKYTFNTQVELNEFMRSAHQLSGMNVNLLKYKAPQNSDVGEALLQVTSKEDTWFKKNKP